MTCRECETRRRITRTIGRVTATAVLAGALIGACIGWRAYREPTST